MDKNTFQRTVTDDTVFWVILGSKHTIATIDNVGGNRFALVFSTEKKARTFYEKARSKVDMYWNNAVVQKTWGEVVTMTMGKFRRHAFFHFDLSPKVDKIDTNRIIYVEQNKEV